jgi:uncharacterized Fe-S cluster-containing radical SAM superfamily enzyme
MCFYVLHKIEHEKGNSFPSMQQTTKEINISLVEKLGDYAIERLNLVDQLSSLSNNI